MTTKPPHEPKSSPALGGSHCEVFPLPLQIFFFFLPPPQAANTATISSTSSSTSSTPGQWQQLLLLRKVASHFTPPVYSFCNRLVACRTWTVTVHVSAEIINMGRWVGPDSAQTIRMGRVRPTPKRNNLMGRVRPNHFGLCLAHLSGPARPTCFNNI